MDPITVIMMAKLAISEVPQVVDLVRSIANAGTVTPEQVAQLRDHYDAAVAEDKAAEAEFDATLPKDGVA